MNTFITDFDLYDPTAANAEPLPKAIHYIAEQAAAVTGVETAFGYGQSPLKMAQARLPAIVFYPTAMDGVRLGIGEIWARNYRITGDLHCKVYDANAIVLKPQLVEPLAMIYGDRFMQKFNDGSTAHATRQGLVASIDCDDVRLETADYIWVTYGKRAYITWRFEWAVEKVRVQS